MRRIELPLAKVLNALFRIFFVGALFGIASPGVAVQGSVVDPNQLKPQTKAAYERVMRTLDNWNTDPAWLDDMDELIERVARDEPRFIPIKAERARLTIMKGNLARNERFPLAAKALDMLVAINKSDPHYARAFVLAGHANTILGRFDAAKVALDRATSLKSADPWLLYNYSDLYGKTGRYDKAVNYAASLLIASKGNRKLVNAAAFQLHTYLPRLEDKNASVAISRKLFDGVKDEGGRIALISAMIKASGASTAILQCTQGMIDLQRSLTPNLPDLNVLEAQSALEAGASFLRRGLPTYSKSSIAEARRLLEKLPPTPRTADRVFDVKTSIAFSEEDLKAADQLIQGANGVSKNLVDEKRAAWLLLTKDYLAAFSLMEELIARDRSYSNHPVLINAKLAMGQGKDYVEKAKYEMEASDYSTVLVGNYAAAVLYAYDDFDTAIKYGERALAKSSYGQLRRTVSMAHLLKAGWATVNNNVAEIKVHLTRAEEIGFDEDYVLERCGVFCPQVREVLKLRADPSALKP